MERKLWFQKLGIACVSAVCHLLYRFRVEGRENVPQGGCIVCVNHSSGMDILLIGCAMTTRYPLALMAKKELFDNRFLNWLLGSLGGFPVDRSRADITAIKKSLLAIQSGEKFIIFPQGTRTKSEDTAAKAGAGMLALRSQAPVVPVYISPHKKLLGRIRVRIGQPFSPDDPGRGDPERYEKAAEQIMERIFDLRHEHA